MQTLLSMDMPQAYAPKPFVLVLVLAARGGTDRLPLIDIAGFVRAARRIDRWFIFLHLVRLRELFYREDADQLFAFSLS